MSNQQDFIDKTILAGNTPGSGQPAAIQSGISGMNEISVEYLNAMINNPKEHPQLREQAQAMKAKLFPESIPNDDATNLKTVIETPKPVKEVKVKKKPKIKTKKSKPREKKPQLIPISTESSTPQDIPSQMASPEDFASVMQNFKQDLYSDSVYVPSMPEQGIKLKSLTVEEYKFLTKQLEMFESNVSILNDDVDIMDRKRKIHIAQLSLNSALDVLLKRCVSNDFNVDVLTIYDWVFLLLQLRLVSRGEEGKFKLTSKDNTSQYIEFNISDLLEYVFDHKEEYTQNIIDYVEIPNKDISLCLMPINRGEYAYIQKRYINDPEASISTMSAALSCKAYVKDGKANVMSLEQRIELVNTLSYDTINEVLDKYDQNNERFFALINEFIKDCNEDAEDIDISDFILFFYDF